MARRNRAEIVVADEVGVYHCVQRVVRRAFLCGVDPVSGNSYDQRRAWIRDRLEYYPGKKDHHKRVTTKHTKGHGKGKLIRILFSVCFGGFRG